jgi:hypothetical protein
MMVMALRNVTEKEMRKGHILINSDLEANVPLIRARAGQQAAGRRAARAVLPGR